MTTMITGGTGLIGARIAHKLVGRGERPVLFDWAPALWRLEDIKEEVDVVRGSVVNLHEVLNAIQKYKVSKIIHLAYVMTLEANANPLAATQVNTVGAVNIYEAAKLLDLERVCIASSMAVYGSDDEYKPSELPLTEDAPKYLAKGALPYAVGKVYMEALGDLYRNNFGVFVCGLRPAILYARGRLTGASAFAGALIEKPALGEPVKVAGGNADVSLVYIDDVVDQWLTLLDADKSRFKHFYFNTGGDRARVYDIAEIVRKFIPDAQIEVERGPEKHIAGFAATVSEKLISEELGFRRRYTPLEVGIKAMIDDVRAWSQQRGISP